MDTPCPQPLAQRPDRGQLAGLLQRHHPALCQRPEPAPPTGQPENLHRGPSPVPVARPDALFLWLPGGTTGPARAHPPPRCLPRPCYPDRQGLARLCDVRHDRRAGNRPHRPWHSPRSVRAGTQPPAELQHQLTAQDRRPHVRRVDRHVLTRTAGCHFRLHDGRRDGTDHDGRGLGGTERRMPCRNDPHPTRESGRPRDLRRLHLERSHAFGLGRPRYAGICTGGHRRRPTRPPLRRPLQILEREQRQRARRPIRL